jgi:predicted nucleic-acid-binding Zn-ribbon protein
MSVKEQIIATLQLLKKVQALSGRKYLLMTCKECNCFVIRAAKHKITVKSMFEAYYIARGLLIYYQWKTESEAINGKN